MAFTTRTLLGMLLVGGTMAAACGDDSETTTSTTTQSTTTTSQSGGGGQGGTGIGGCASCNEWLMDPVNVAITSVCGVDAYDEMTNELTCTPDTSCDLLAALIECACGPGCADSDECGPTLCDGDPSTPIGPACEICFEEIDGCNPSMGGSYAACAAD